MKVVVEQLQPKSFVRSSQRSCHDGQRSLKWIGERRLPLRGSGTQAEVYDVLAQYVQKVSKEVQIVEVFEQDT